jgi:DNA polymerase-3 subunit delta'
MNLSASLPFPWQQPQWQHLYRLHQADRLPHALLFTGQAGLGKYLFALHFAKTLHCTPALQTGKACQHCRDCLLVEAHTHPDLTCIVPEKTGKGIKIEQVRQFIEQSNQTTSSPYKIIIIHPADSLLVAASNALLKNLEEPTSRTLFILITDKPGHLLPTIRSRCQLIRFNSPPTALGKQWLREQIPEVEGLDELYSLANEAPLQALRYAKTGVLTVYHDLLSTLMQLLKKEGDPITLAEKHVKTELSMLLLCLTQIVSELIKCHFIDDHESPQRTRLHLFAKNITVSFLFPYLQQLINYQKHTKIALNPQLLLESLFCAWSLQGKT